MSQTVFDGSPAHGGHPHLLRPVRRAPRLRRQEPDDWGLGFEVRGTKAPHWTAPDSSPRTFGLFGQSGSFLWVDPDHRVACVAAGSVPFGPWAAEAWPRLATRLLRKFPLEPVR